MKRATIEKTLDSSFEEFLEKIRSKFPRTAPIVIYRDDDQPDLLHTFVGDDWSLGALQGAIAAMIEIAIGRAQHMGVGDWLNMPNLAADPAGAGETESKLQPQHMGAGSEPGE